MPTSEKQIEANRRNALASTGPRTRAGRKRSRQNALKHGLTAETLVTFGEDPEKLETLLQGIVSELQPGSQMEKEAAERIASLMWRLRRIPQIEAGLFSIVEAEIRLEHSRIVDPDRGGNHYAEWRIYQEQFRVDSLDSDDEVLSEAAASFDLPQARLAGAFKRDADNADALGRLSRYEGILMRQLERSLELFHRLKAERLHRSDLQKRTED